MYIVNLYCGDLNKNYLWANLVFKHISDWNWQSFSMVYCSRQHYIGKDNKILKEAITSFCMLVLSLIINSNTQIP